MSTRTRAFAYGAITIGGASETTYILNSAITVEGEYRHRSASCEVMVRVAPGGDLPAAETALLAEFRKPFLTLVLTYGGTTRTFDHDANSGFNQAPTIQRVPKEDDCTTISHWEVTVSFNRPADNVGDDFLADLSFTVNASPGGILSLSIEGVYTAKPGPAVSATAQYAASIDALVATLQAEASATARWDIDGIRTKRGKENKNVSFVHRYLQSTDREKLDGTNDAAISHSNTRVSIRWDASAPMPAEGETREKVISLTYGCLFVRSQVTNEEDLRNKWITVILPNLKDKINKYVDTHQDSDSPPPFYITIMPVFNLAIPSLEAEIICVVRAGNLLEGSVSYESKAVPPWRLLPMFSTEPMVKKVVPGLGEASVAISGSFKIINASTRTQAIAEAQVFMPGFDKTLVVGSNAAIASRKEFTYGNRYSEIDSESAREWQITLDDHIEGPLLVTAEGPTFLGIDKHGAETSITVVEFGQAAEYFKSTGGNRVPTGGISTKKNIRSVLRRPE